MSCRHCHRFNNVSCVVSDRGRYFALFVDEKLFHRDCVIIKPISRERYFWLRHRGVRRCRVVV